MSPRANSPTSSLSMQQIADALRRYEQDQREEDMQVDDEMDIDMNGVNVNEGGNP